ncbi:hypothetical protein [Nostoc parmelioides]|uniref:hypothetical protein n=1 Tax=Nostoc parmelioides TaxID=1521621 RepID=UPI0016891CA9|nr:hypothetical protein [Nostoc parmelioides]
MPLLIVFALRIEVASATLPVAASLSRAGYEVLGFGWCVSTWCLGRMWMQPRPLFTKA